MNLGTIVYFQLKVVIIIWPFIFSLLNFYWKTLIEPLILPTMHELD